MASCYHFPAKVLILARTIRYTMAGVFELIMGPQPQKRLVGRHGVVQRADPRALELQAAMEILAEVFGIRTSEVEEIIRVRSEEREMWPERFWTAEE